MRKKYFTAFAAVTLLLVISVALWLIIGGISFENPVAKIYQNGILLYEIPLSEVDEEYEIVITGADGCTNTVCVRHGEIGIISADCPDKTCVNTGFIGNGVVPVICIPNKLEIRIENASGGEIDGVVR